MFKNMPSVRLGVFIILGIVLLVLGIFLVGQKNSLFSSTFEVRAYFKNIQGLRTGTTVRLSGIDVGSVSGVEIMNDTSGRVQVTMNLQTYIKRFIRTDTKASIESEGLVGNKVIVLKIGSSQAEPIKNGGVIQSEEPIGLTAIIAQTEGIMEYTKNMTKDLSEIVGRVNHGEGSIGKLLTDDKLYNNATHLTKRADESLRGITDELDKVTELFNRLGGGVETTVNNINKVITNVDTIVSGINQGKGVAGGFFSKNGRYDSTVTSTLSNIQKTSEEAKAGATRLAENMEALKHNWLFKEYFENRGYWDKTEYEDKIDNKLKELDAKIKLLDEKIETLKKLQNTVK
ncbi:MAG: MlaD family protein [Ignavibacteriaceae bacterium]